MYAQCFLFFFPVINCVFIDTDWIILYFLMQEGEIAEGQEKILKKRPTEVFVLELYCCALIIHILLKLLLL